MIRARVRNRIARVIGAGLAITLLGAGGAGATSLWGMSRAVQETASPQEQVLTDPALEAQVEEIARTLRCPTCRALSVEDSPSGMAGEMRDLIREQLVAGKSPDEVKAYFVERYGEWILLKPKATGFNWTVWLLPIVLLAGGLLFVLVTARRWVRRGAARAQALTESGPETN